MNSKINITVAATGASGAIYTQLLLDKLTDTDIRTQFEKLALIQSPTAQQIWREELGNKDYENYNIDTYAYNNYYAPMASGSSDYNVLIICPCSMGNLAKIAQGISGDLITRAADVMLKERRKLIIVPRETPYNTIHLRNMQILTEAGAIICPASPSFYSKPQTIEQAVMTVIERILTLSGLEFKRYKWMQKE